MIDERQQELAALYALDLLDNNEERSAFEVALTRDAALRDLVRELRESAGAYALTVPQVAPAPELKARVLARIQTASASRPADNIIRPSAFAFRFWQVVPWAAAVVFAFASAWLGQLYLSGRAENALLRDQQQLADLELRSARQQTEAERLIANRQIANATQRIAELDREIAQSSKQLAATSSQISELREKLQTEGDLAQFKIATLASLAGNSPAALAVAVWNPSRQEGVFKIEKMPRPGSDQDYELWVIDPAQSKPVSAGVFAVGADGVARVQFKPESPIATAAKFAVSRERKGGAPAHSGPQGQVLMLSD